MVTAQTDGGTIAAPVVKPGVDELKRLSVVAPAGATPDASDRTNVPTPSTPARLRRTRPRFIFPPCNDDGDVSDRRYSAHF